jgi:hypothetical protein
MPKYRYRVPRAELGLCLQMNWTYCSDSQNRTVQIGLPKADSSLPKSDIEHTAVPVRNDSPVA